MVRAVAKRKQPTSRQKEELLDRAGHACEYCHRMFGSVVRDRNGKDKRLVVEYDHLVPYCYLQDNPVTNWIVSCQICNGHKGSTIFDSWDELCDFLWDAQERNGYETIWRASVAATFDREESAREYMRWRTEQMSYAIRGINDPFRGVPVAPKPVRAQVEDRPKVPIPVKIVIPIAPSDLEPGQLMLPFELSELGKASNSRRGRRQKHPRRPVPGLLPLFTL